MQSMHRAARRSGLLTWLLVLLGATITQAQSPGSFEYSRGDRTLILVQLELSITYAERAARALEGGAGAESLGGAKAFTVQSYRLLRFALAGVEELKSDAAGSSATGRIAELATKSIARAMEHNRQAQHAIGESIAWIDSREKWIPTAIGELKQTARLAGLAVSMVKAAPTR